MNRTDHTLRALRDLDPATTGDALTPAQRERAEATLARVLASDPDAHPRTAPATTRSRRRRTRLVLAAGAGVAAAAATVVLVPALTGDTGAYAGWTPTPEQLGAERAAAAAATCVAGFDGEETPGTPLVAESRGEWTYVLVQAGQRSYSCFFPDELVGQRLAEDETRFFGTAGPMSDLGEQPRPDRVVEDTAGTGVTSEDDTFTFVEGRVGSRVEDVTITLEGGQQVEASVDNGRFAAWWPSGKSSQTHGMTEAFTVEGRLADGTVVSPEGP